MGGNPRHPTYNPYSVLQCEGEEEWSAAMKGPSPPTFAAIARGPRRRGRIPSPERRERRSPPYEGGGGGREGGGRVGPAPFSRASATCSHCNHGLVQGSFIQANNPSNMSNVGNNNFDFSLHNSVYNGESNDIQGRSCAWFILSLEGRVVTGLSNLVAGPSLSGISFRGTYFH